MSSPEIEPTILDDPSQALQQFVEFGLPSGFENPYVAAGSCALLAVGIVAGGGRFVKDWRLAQNIKEETSPSFIPNDSMRDSASKQVKRNARKTAAALFTASAALSTLGAHAAEPFTESARSTVDNVSVIFAADNSTFAEDVESDNGENIARIEAAVSGILNLNNRPGLTLANVQDVEITHIVAGSQAKSVGITAGGEGKSVVSNQIQEYINVPANRAQADYAGALALADQADADYVLILGNDVPGEALPALRGEALEEQNKVSVIALGTNGTELEMPSRTIEAVVDKVGNDQAVGAEDSYVVESLDELQETVSTIIGEQYLETEQTEYNKFLTASVIAFSLLGAGVYLKNVTSAGLSVLSNVVRRSKKA